MLRTKIWAVIGLLLTLVFFVVNKECAYFMPYAVAIYAIVALAFIKFVQA